MSQYKNTITNSWLDNYFTNLLTISTEKNGDYLLLNMTIAEEFHRDHSLTNKTIIKKLLKYFSKLKDTPLVDLKNIQKAFAENLEVTNLTINSIKNFIEQENISKIIDAYSADEVQHLNQMFQRRKLSDYLFSCCSDHPFGMVKNSKDFMTRTGVVLRTMDIVSQRESVRKLLENEDFEKNDLKKVQHLSGTFCQLVKKSSEINGKIIQGEVLEPRFSGMILPGQTVQGNTIKIVTCLHGFIDGENANINKWYFVPYGVYPTKEYAFQLKALSYISEENIDLPKKSEEWLQDDTVALSEEDCIYANIEVKNSDGNTIQGVLEDECIEEGFFLFKKQNSNEVVNLNLIDEMNTNNLFAFGYPGEGWLGDSKIDGYTLTTNFLNIEEENLDKFTIMIDKLFYTPNNKRVMSNPVTWGMSGGPVVACSVDNNEIKCKLIGVINGAMLIKDTKNNTISYKSILASREQQD